MEIRAQHRNARMAPRKIRWYREMLRGLPVNVADAQLQFMPGKAPATIRAVLKSAVANAQHNFDITAEKLTVADVIIDGGFALKRFRPVSRGMAHPILKRTSHVTVVIADAQGTETKRGRKTEIEELTAADIASGKVGGNTPTSEVTEKEPVAGPTTPHRSKQEEAYTKMKMQQQGGDPKKSHRRKSMGE